MHGLPVCDDGEGRFLGGDAGVNFAGIEIGPTRVERVVSLHSGSRSSERPERACLPMSMDCESMGKSGSHNVL